MSKSTSPSFLLRLLWFQVLNQVFNLFYYYFLPLRATPMAYGDSQARDPVGASAAGLHHSHSSPQCWILNPLSKARDPTCNLLVPSQICFCCAMRETPFICFPSFVCGCPIFLTSFIEALVLHCIFLVPLC